jgi:Tc5 transposase DNA-binding domain
LLSEAVAFYRDNDHLSIRKIAQLFKFSHATLSRRIAGTIGSLFERKATNSRLTEDQESALIQYIYELHNIGVPLRVKAIEHAANSILAIANSSTNALPPPPPPVGEHWVTRFLERHDEIKKMKQKAIELDRKQAANDRESITTLTTLTTIKLRNITSHLLTHGIWMKWAFVWVLGEANG